MTEERFSIKKGKIEWRCHECDKVIPKGSYLLFDENWVYMRWCINCATKRLNTALMNNENGLKQYKRTIRETKKNADKIIKNLNENRSNYEKWNACAELGREVV